MADGTHKPIEDVKIGDKVIATDPETGETHAKEVIATIVGDGHKNLVQITIDTDGTHGDKTGLLIATDNHPFWIAGHLKKWINAHDLKPGMWLRTSAGTYVQITAIKRSTAQQRVHNLTVKSLHTFYVVVEGADALVYNAGPCSSAGNYRKNFRDANPGMPGNYQVHHSLPQKYEQTLWDAGVNIHENRFLQGVDPKIHSKITTEWSRWDRSLDRTPSASEIIRFARYVDLKYGQYWY